MTSLVFEGRLSKAFRKQDGSTYCICLDCGKVYLDDLRMDIITGASILCPICGMALRTGLNVADASDLLKKGLMGE